MSAPASKSTDAVKPEEVVVDVEVDKTSVTDTESTSTTKETGASPDQKDVTSADYYFDSYSHFGIHEEMLKDEVRTRTYMNSIMQNKHLFKDKIVLDVGCGTGILSMFAAKAGARHVYSVECSGIAVQAKKIVKANGLDSKVTVIQGKMEEVELPVDKVDIIISEWMGYFLLYESMLDTVLYARDKWLVPGGMILPDKATMYVAAIEDGEYREEKIDFWDDVYGFDMSAIKEIALTEPLVDTVDGSSLISTSARLLDIDILTCTVEDLTFKAEFEVRAGRDDFCHGFVVWFDTDFSQIHKKLTLTTAPSAPYTHWKQTVFYFDRTLTVKEGDTITAKIDCAPNSGNRRDLDIGLDVTLAGSMDTAAFKMDYRMR